MIYGFYRDEAFDPILDKVIRILYGRKEMEADYSKITPRINKTVREIAKDKDADIVIKLTDP